MKVKYTHLVQMNMVNLALDKIKIRKFRSITHLNSFNNYKTLTALKLLQGSTILYR